MKRRWFFILTASMSGLAMAALLPAAEAESPRLPRMLVPGFEIVELPVELTSLNNVEYAPDGRLFAGGYDGRFHLLKDTNNDGLEDRVVTFWPESSSNFSLGMVVKDGAPHSVVADELIAFRDTDGDGVPDRRETIISGFDDPELAKAPYLDHRRVDSSMALAWGPDGAWYVTFGNAAYNNPYWQESFEKGKAPAGPARYSPDKRRGCLLRITPDGKVEQLASGLRYIMSLQWNRHGDLFATDQEGATWCPNGNPFDELLHLQPGRHYGFPPRHPRLLPGVIDEPSVFDYAPQHQSTCGFRFNTPSKGRGRLGPTFWEDDALVTGESRGNLYRTALAKTAAGYVARTELIARLGLLAVDCTLSPEGHLVVCCHTGTPDWGNGPQGRGRVFKIRPTVVQPPQPILAWADSETRTAITFDRPVPVNSWKPADIRVESGRSVTAGDRDELMRPGYAVVQHQQRQRRDVSSVESISFTDNAHTVILETAPRRDAVTSSLALKSEYSGYSMDLAHDLSGVHASWQSNGRVRWQGWLPHIDLTAARHFTRSSVPHGELWKHITESGSLELQTQLDLWNMLQPLTQPTSQLDYEPSPERVQVTFRSDAALELTCTNASVKQVSDREARLDVDHPREFAWIPIGLKVATPVTRLDVSFTTDADSRPRAIAVRRILMPFAIPRKDDRVDRSIPELAGGDWHRGRQLFLGKAACSTCHIMRGEGTAVGADLNNLLHRDYATVRRDLLEPSAVINPDAIGYTLVTTSGQVHSGVLSRESADSLTLLQAGGKTVQLKRSEVEAMTPMAKSLMPEGLDKLLTDVELKDLMTFLMTEPPGER
jgi:putative heme-binding domain-containing protein